MAPYHRFEARLRMQKWQWAEGRMGEGQYHTSQRWLLREAGSEATDLVLGLWYGEASGPGWCWSQEG